MIVVDCAVVVDALVADVPAIRSLLAAEAIHAPDLIDYEVLSAVRGLTLGGHITARRGLDALADFALLPVSRWPLPEPFRRRAFDLRASMTAYDAAYVVLAEGLGCPLVTRDARLVRAGGHRAEITLV